MVPDQSAGLWKPGVPDAGLRRTSWSGNCRERARVLQSRCGRIEFIFRIKQVCRTTTPTCFWILVVSSPTCLWWKLFFPRVRTPCGHGAQVIIEGREEKTDGGERNKDPKKQTPKPNTQARRPTPPSCSLPYTLGETCETGTSDN